MRITLAKLHFLFDLETVEPELDWQKESRMKLLWVKPALLVRIQPAQNGIS